MGHEVWGAYYVRDHLPESYMVRWRDPNPLAWPLTVGTLLGQVRR